MATCNRCKGTGKIRGNRDKMFSDKHFIMMKCVKNVMAPDILKAQSAGEHKLGMDSQKIVLNRTLKTTVADIAGMIPALTRVEMPDQMQKEKNGSHIGGQLFI